MGESGTGAGSRPGAAALLGELPLRGQWVPGRVGVIRRGWQGAARGGGLRRAQEPPQPICRVRPTRSGESMPCTSRPRIPSKLKDVLTVQVVLPKSE